MEFGLSNEQSLLQDQTARFVKDKIPLDVVRAVAEGIERDSTIWSELTDIGLPGIMIDERLGGLGLGLLDASIIAECLGHGVTPGPYLSSSIIAPTVLQLSAKRDDILAKIVTGETRVGIAFNQAIRPNHESGFKVKNEKLEGKLLFAMDSEADYYLVADSDKKIYLVDRNSVGFRSTPLSTIEKTRSSAELKFSKVVGEKISDDPNIFDKAWNAGLVATAADSLGAAQCAFDQAVSYANQREQFNRVIASFQAVKHMCAEMAAQLEPCRAMVWYAAHAFSDIPEESTMMASHTKAHLSEVGQFVTRTATEVHGGMGFTDLIGLHYWFKRCGFNRQVLGSPELLRERAANAQDLVS